MEKEQKIILIRIIVAAVMTGTLMALRALGLLDLPVYALFLLNVVPYLIAGYDVLLEAAEGIVHGELLDECFLMAVATLGALALGWISGGGLFSFSGSWTPLAVVAAAALAMAVFTYFSEKKGMAWLDNFSIAGSMLIGMLAAVLIGQ